MTLRELIDKATLLQKKLPHYKNYLTPLATQKRAKKNAEDDDSRNFFRNFARLTD